MSSEGRNDVVLLRTKPPIIEKLQSLKVTGPDREALQKIHALMTKYPEVWLQGYIVGDRPAFEIISLEVYEKYVTDELRKEFASATQTATRHDCAHGMLGAYWFDNLKKERYGREVRPPRQADDVVLDVGRIELKIFGAQTFGLLKWPLDSSHKE